MLKLTMDPIDQLLLRGVEIIYPSKKELEVYLKSGKKLKLYQGFDPSMSSLHLGNLVGLMKLRQFQKLGHEVIFLVGDFTGMIGDPTDKPAVRKMLTREQTIKNSETWKKQASKILDFTGSNPVKLLFNSSWLDKVSFKDLIEITSKFTVQQLLERDMFQERIKENKPIFLHEFLYPVAQAYDSVEMNVDLEVGGSDQIFNMLAGRTLVKAVKNKEKFVLATKLLVDSKGEKAGKTTGNALFLDSAPEDFYGGIMSFSDELIYLGFELLTEVSLEGLESRIKENPLKEKKALAFEIVKLLWGEDLANKAQQDFQKTFQERTPDYETNVKALGTLAETIAQFTRLSTLSEAKRQVKQGAVDVNEKTVTDPSYQPKKGDKIRVGKKTFLTIE